MCCSGCACRNFLAQRAVHGWFCLPGYFWWPPFLRRCNKVRPVKQGLGWQRHLRLLPGDAAGEHRYALAAAPQSATDSTAQNSPASALPHKAVLQRRPKRGTGATVAPAATAQPRLRAPAKQTGGATACPGSTGPVVDEDVPPQNDSMQYIGNLNTHKFHRPSCSTLPKESNRIYFDTREEAIADGYIPCKRCNP